MKTKLFLLSALTAVLFLVSCKKESSSIQIAFPNNTLEGTANANGEFNLTGHISSATRLEKVVLTKEGQPASFLEDVSTAKNKNEYDFNYLVTGITANTYIIMDIYDQAGGKLTQRYLIKK